MNIKKELYTQILEAKGLLKDTSFNNGDSKEFQYKLPENIGYGNFYFYCLDDMFAVGNCEVRFYKDTFIEFQKPNFLSIQYFRSVSGEKLHPYCQLSPNTLHTDIGNGEKVYQAIYHKNMPLSSVIINIMPEFYQKHLENKVNDKNIHLYNTFHTISPRIKNPKIILLLREIQSYSGFGASAKLFYEKKVLETVDLIFDEICKSNERKRKLHMSLEDELNLKSALHYIDHHFTFGVTLEQLSKITFMGTTKLKTAFKEYVGCSISEYIIGKRIDHAQHLLLATDLTIAEIAKAVGYERSDSFSSQFFKITGFLPTEYRNLTKGKSNIGGI